MSALPKTAEAVLTFLESVGRRSEAELYLRVFRELPRESFAIIAPGAPAVLRGQGALSMQLGFLQDLGLSATVVVGLFDPAEAGVSAERLFKRLEAAGVRASRAKPSEPGLVERLRSELGQGAFPIVELGPDLSLPRRIEWFCELSAAFDSRKLCLLRRRGPLRVESERSSSLAERHMIPVEGGAISLINLRTDAELLDSRRWLRKPDAALLEAAREVLSASRARRLVVSVTSPLDLLRELFTVRGAGTLIKRGTAIQRVSTYSQIDAKRLHELFKLSFTHPLQKDFFDKPAAAIYVEEDYRAASVVLDTEVVPYLSKFAVDPELQGEGIGRDLWQVLARDFPTMFWRTRAENRISSWYSGLADGLWRGAEWHVFWRGIEPARMPSVVEYALGLPDDFLRS